MRGRSCLVKNARLHPEGFDAMDATFAYNAKAGCVNAVRADGRTRVLAEALNDRTRVRRCKRKCIISGGPEGKELTVTLPTIAEAQDLFGRLTGTGTIWKLGGRDLAIDSVVLTKGPLTTPAYPVWSGRTRATLLTRQWFLSGTP